VCSEMIESTDFPHPASVSSLTRLKVKLSDGQRVHEATVHHQIRQPDVRQVREVSVTTSSVYL